MWPRKKEKDFVEIAQEYRKYHIVAVLGLQIILESGITQSNINDVTILPPMLYKMRRQHLLPGPSVFHADRECDSNYNCQMLFEMGDGSQYQTEKHLLCQPRQALPKQGGQDIR